MVRMRISVAGEALRIWRVASTPLRRGMPISRMAMWGLCLAAFSTASRLSGASGEMCQRERDGDRARKAAPTAGWASAMQIEECGIDVILADPSGAEKPEPEEWVGGA